jgi:hypothetical protein
MRALSPAERLVLERTVGARELWMGPLTTWYVKSGIRGIMDQAGSEEALKKYLPPKTEGEEGAPGDTKDGEPGKKK